MVDWLNPPWGKRRRKQFELAYRQFQRKYKANDKLPIKITVETFDYENDSKLAFQGG